jgi:endonuclease-3 related protein
MSTTTDLLMQMYQAMRERFGPRNWWPSAAGADTTEGKLEICLGAILTQNTSWGNIELAIENLRQAGALSVDALHALPQAQLADLIHPAGYFNVKAGRLRNFIAAVREAGGIEAFLAPPAYELREAMLCIRGVGRETADSIILYAAGKPSFVIDTYTARIMSRHRLIGPEDDYDSIKELFESALSQDVALWNDYHAQLVEVGKQFCRKSAPLCAGCPLEQFPHDTEL